MQRYIKIGIKKLDGKNEINVSAKKVIRIIRKQIIVLFLLIFRVLDRFALLELFDIGLTKHISDPVKTH